MLRTYENMFTHVATGFLFSVKRKGNSVKGGCPKPFTLLPFTLFPFHAIYPFPFPGTVNCCNLTAINTRHL